MSLSRRSSSMNSMNRLKRNNFHLSNCPSVECSHALNRATSSLSTAAEEEECGATESNSGNSVSMQATASAPTALVPLSPAHAAVDACSVEPFQRQISVDSSRSSHDDTSMDTDCQSLLNKTKRFFIQEQAKSSRRLNQSCICDPGCTATDRHPISSLPANAHTIVQRSGSDTSSHCFDHCRQCGLCAHSKRARISLAREFQPATESDSPRQAILALNSSVQSIRSAPAFHSCIARSESDTTQAAPNARK